ncbi:MAG: beta-ketoacyl-ACP synthase II [Anaerovoracaceae bacterium]|jgi:3-oxoacyl-[acyl-carrier-protein] synthase II
MEKRRVVVTGYGVVAPIGNNSVDFWQNIKDGVSGIDRITHFDLTDHKALMAAEVKNFEYPDKRAARALDPTSQYALVAAKEAMEMSGLVPGENIDPYELGVYGSSGIGGIQTIEDQAYVGILKSVKRISPHMITMSIPNIVSGNISIELGACGSAFGLNSACATGTHTIGEAFRAIRDGYQTAIVAGSTEASIVSIPYAGFESMRALSTVDDREHCCMPFDKNRSGFVMGEGAAFLILEELEHAEERGASIFAEVAGYGSASDAYHVTMPDPEGKGDIRAMELAIKDAGIDPSAIDYINAHGTGTIYNDKIETLAIKEVLGKHAYEIPVSSTKAMTGHSLGAVGSIEGLICVKALEEGFVPATVGLEEPDEGLDLDYVPGKGREMDLEYVMSNSLGFGGHNAAIIFRKWNGPEVNA